MPSRDNNRRLQDLRRRAEKQADRQFHPEDLAEALEIAQELHNHQVELKLHNEELMQDQQELTLAHNLYQKLFNLAPVGYLRLDPQNTILEANKEAAKLLSDRRTALKGSPLSTHIDMQSLEMIQQHFIQAIGSIEGAVDEIVLKNGQTVQMHTLALERVNDSQGFLTALVDINERVRYEEELRRSQQSLARQKARLQAVIEQTPAGLLLAQAPEGKVLLRNVEAVRIMGQPMPEVQRLEEFDWVGLITEQGDRLEIKDYPLYRALQGEDIKDIKFSRRTADGRTQIMSMNAAPIKDAQGNIVNAICAFLDVTEEEHIKQELTRLNQKLEERVASRTAELESQTVKLQEANIALKVLLENRDQERHTLEEAIMANLNRLVLPLLERLDQAPSREARTSLLQAVKSHLKDLTSGFTPKLTSAQYLLSARELEVAGLIKAGKSSDEIAEILCISTSSVLFHRNNIREKLGLKGEKMRLSSYLRRIT